MSSKPFITANADIPSLFDTLGLARAAQREAEMETRRVSEALLKRVIDDGLFDCLKIDEPRLRRYVRR